MAIEQRPLGEGEMKIAEVYFCFIVFVSFVMFGYVWEIFLKDIY